MNREEFSKTLLQAFGGARSKDGGEYYVFHGNVVHMLAHCLESIAAGFTSRSFPELYKLLAPEDPDVLHEEVRQLHLCVGRLLNRINENEPLDQPHDTTVFESLSAVGWENTTQRARTAWLSMLGLYHLSRVWVIGRQAHYVGSGMVATSETIGQAADQLFRIQSQSLTPEADGAAAVRAATKYALWCGLRLYDIQDAVRHVAVSEKVDEKIDFSAMSRVAENGDAHE